MQAGDSVWVDDLDDEQSPGVVLNTQPGLSLATVRLETSGREYKVSFKSLRRRAPSSANSSLPNPGSSGSLHTNENNLQDQEPRTSTSPQPQLSSLASTVSAGVPASTLPDVASLPDPTIPDIVLAVESHCANGGTILKSGTMALILPPTTPESLQGASPAAVLAPRYAPIADAVAGAGAFSQVDQTLMAHGRPGSGKTTCLQQVLLHIAADCGAEAALVKQMQQAYLLLSAFTSAHSAGPQPSPHSTRCCTRLALHMGPTSQPLGFTASVHLLDTTRLTQLPLGASTFHALHLLVCGTPRDVASDLHLRASPSAYPLLALSKDTPGSIRDTSRFAQLCDALADFGILPAELQHLWGALSAILLLTTVTFSEITKQSTTPAGSSSAAIAAAADLLGVGQPALWQLLSAGSMAAVRRKRDTVVSELYTQAVEWLVGRINAVAGPPEEVVSEDEGHRWKVEAVDVGGVLEDQGPLGLQQLLLSFLADATTEAAISDCFADPRNRARAAGVELPDIRRTDYSRDRLDFLETQGNSVLPALNDLSTSNMHGVTFATLREMVRLNPSARSVAEFPQYPEDTFVVRHCTAKAEYHLKHFLVDNIAAVPQDMLQLFKTSSNPIIAQAAAAITAQHVPDRTALAISVTRGALPRIRPSRAQATLQLLDDIRAAAANADFHGPLPSPSTHHLVCLPHPTARDQLFARLLKVFSVEQAARVSGLGVAVRLPLQLCAERWSHLVAAGKVDGTTEAETAGVNAADACRFLLSHASIPQSAYTVQDAHLYLGGAAATALFQHWRQATAATLLPSLSSYERRSRTSSQPLPSVEDLFPDAPPEAVDALPPADPIAPASWEHPGSTQALSPFMAPPSAAAWAAAAAAGPPPGAAAAAVAAAAAGAASNSSSSGSRMDMMEQVSLEIRQARGNLVPTDSVGKLLRKHTDGSITPAEFAAQNGAPRAGGPQGVALPGTSSGVLRMTTSYYDARDGFSDTASQPLTNTGDTIPPTPPTPSEGTPIPPPFPSAAADPTLPTVVESAEQESIQTWIYDPLSESSDDASPPPTPSPDPHSPEAPPTLPSIFPPPPVIYPTPPADSTSPKDQHPHPPAAPSHKRVEPTPTLTPPVTPAPPVSPTPPVPSPYTSPVLQSHQSLIDAFPAFGVQDPNPTLPPTTAPPPAVGPISFSPLHQHLRAPRPTASTSLPSHPFPSNPLPSNPPVTPQLSTSISSFPPRPAAVWASTDAFNFGHSSDEIVPASPVAPGYLSSITPPAQPPLSNLGPTRYPPVNAALQDPHNPQAAPQAPHAGPPNNAPRAATPLPLVPSTRPPPKRESFAQCIDDLQVYIADSHHVLELEVRALLEVASGQRMPPPGATPSRILSDFLAGYKQRNSDIKDKLKVTRKELAAAKKELGGGYSNLSADIAQVEAAHKQWKRAFKARMAQAQKQVSEYDKGRVKVAVLPTGLLPHHRRKPSHE